MARLYLSPPQVGDAEIAAVEAAMRSGWISPLGPEVRAFEEALAGATGRKHAVALSSGTAALHLGLNGLGVEPGQQVVVPTLTFGATAFAVTYQGATPIFIDVEDVSWNLDPHLLEELLDTRAKASRLPAAVISVDLFGRTCNVQEIQSICSKYNVPLLSDSAEALGATYDSKPAGSQGEAAVLSFNGNKIITTSGGGALVTDNAKLAAHVRKWSNQSREPFPWYQHEEIGFNYRMSNLLAALGRVQLSRLEEIVTRRREIHDRYASGFAALEGVTVLGDPPWGRWNGWLTTVRFDSTMHPGMATKIREHLESLDIEARPVWKPMHQQPVFRSSEAFLTGVADSIFEEGLCLPSGQGMTDTDIDRVVDASLRAIE